jgi:hypothetical protein
MKKITLYAITKLLFKTINGLRYIDVTFFLSNALHYYEVSFQKLTLYALLKRFFEKKLQLFALLKLLFGKKTNALSYIEVIFQRILTHIS